MDASERSCPWRSWPKCLAFPLSCCSSPSSRSASRSGSACPRCCCYLGIGLLLGESGIGIRFDNAQLTQSLGIAALVLILAEGGLTTRWSTVKPALGLGIVLSIVAVVVSIGVTGVALHYLLGLDWRTGLLWGAVLSSTDAAAVFSVLRGINVSKKLVGALELESGLNDAPVYIAVVLLASGEEFTWHTPLLVGYELAVGALIGIALGWARRVRAAPGRTARHRPVPVGDHVGLRARLRGQRPRRRVRPARHLRVRAGARQLAPAAPRRHALLRGGIRLAGPDRPVRAARPLRVATRNCSPRWCPVWSPARSSCCWPARSRLCSPPSVSACPGGKRRSCPGRGCAARCRSCSR